MAVLVAAMMIMAMAVPAWAADKTVTFNSVGGSNTPSAQVVAEGSNLDLSTFSPGTLSDHTFRGWSLSNVSAGTMATTIKTLRNVTENTNVYAVWQANTTPVYSITIDNALVGEKYSIYKIFDVTYSGSTTPGSVPDAPAPDNTHNNQAYAYTINASTSEWWAVVTNNKDASTVATAGASFAENGLKFTKNTNPNEYNVEKLESFDAAAFAGVLNNKKASKTLATTSPITATDTNFTVYLNDDGYYFVDTTMGSFCSLDTTEPDATIREKNTMPTVEKKVAESNLAYNSGDWADTGTYSIGDNVYYKITVTDGKGTGDTNTLTVHDKLDTGVTLIMSSFNVVDKNGTAISTEYYKVYYDGTLVGTQIDETTGTIDTNKVSKDSDGFTDGCTFEVVFTAAGMDKYAEGDKLIITYTGKLNDKAKIGHEGIHNKTWLNYSFQESEPDEVTAYTYAGALYKYTEAGAALGGAVFEMTDPQLSDRTMYFAEKTASSASEPNVYYYDSSVTTATTGFTTRLTAPASGAILILGLEDATYTVTEKEAPAGYYPLPTTVSLPVAVTTGTLASNLTTSSTKGSSANNVVYVTGTYDKYNGVTYELATSSTPNLLWVENTTGAELPSTGGMGTTVLYIVGGMLIVLAGAYLFFSRKRTA